MKFKNTSGKWLTKALFFELTPAIRPHAVFTLKDQDHVVGEKTYFSLKRLFLESDDPTEYKFATKHLGGWGHWKEIQKTDELLAEIEEWREERDVRLRSLGVKKLIESAEKGNYQAAKFLTDKGWDVQTKGRPTKDQVKRAAKEQAGVLRVVDSDLKRIRDLNRG